MEFCTFPASDGSLLALSQHLLSLLFANDLLFRAFLLSFSGAVAAVWTWARLLRAKLSSRESSVYTFIGLVDNAVPWAISGRCRAQFIAAIVVTSSLRRRKKTIEDCECSALVGFVKSSFYGSSFLVASA